MSRMKRYGDKVRRRRIENYNLGPVVKSTEDERKARHAGSEYSLPEMIQRAREMRQNVTSCWDAKLYLSSQLVIQPYT